MSVSLWWSGEGDFLPLGFVRPTLLRPRWKVILKKRSIRKIMLIFNVRDDMRLLAMKNSPTAAESWIITYLQVWGFLPVNLHFATKLFTAVPNFLAHWMWVPAPYKQTKNQTYATTDITAGSCYREVRWNWKVSTNGQNPTFSHLSARSQLRKWQWPSSSRCVAGHRQGHPEKDPHFSKELAHGCWKLKNNLSPSLGLFTRESSLCD